MRCATVAMLVVTAACSSRPRGAAHDLPPRPPLGAQIERAGRPLTGNALVGLFAADDVADRRKEQYNRAAPADWPGFAPDLAASLALYDGFDGTCGNQWLVAPHGAPAQRYRALAQLLADDRLWVDSAAKTCTQFMAVERSALGGPAPQAGDCGGRTPNYDAVDMYRSLLAAGAPTGIDDGVDADEHPASTTEFPFLAPP
jgi:hypothetical protein